MKRRTYQQIARRQGQGVDKLLGELQAEIMELLWEKDGTVTVRDVLTWLNSDREQPVAYTTVMTVMAHLVEKGLLKRTLVGKTHQYQIAQSRDDFLRRSSREIVEELMADFGEVAIASFLEAIESVDPRRLQKLRRSLGE